jgi:hypothetical protein
MKILKTERLLEETLQHSVSTSLLLPVQFSSPFWRVRIQDRRL